MKKYLGILFIAILLLSCNRHEKIYDEVMDIHDVAMANMDQIMTLKVELKENIESLNSDTLVDNTAQIEEINSLISDLESADEGMMNWMREFHDDYEHVAKSEIMDYLEEQKEKITAVGKTINEAIDNAQKFLAKGI